MEQEQKKTITIRKSTLFIFLAVLVFAVMGFFIVKLCIDNENSKKEIAALSSQIGNGQNNSNSNYSSSSTYAAPTTIESALPTQNTQTKTPETILSTVSNGSFVVIQNNSYITDFKWFHGLGVSSDYGYDYVVNVVRNDLAISYSGNNVILKVRSNDMKEKYAFTGSPNIRGAGDYTLVGVNASDVKKVVIAATGSYIPWINVVILTNSGDLYAYDAIILDDRYEKYDSIPNIVDIEQGYMEFETEDYGVKHNDVNFDMLIKDGNGKYYSFGYLKG